VIICLVWNSELHAAVGSSLGGTAEAGRLNNIGTFFILYLNTLSLLSGGALRVGSSLALGGVVVNRDLSDDGHVVVDDDIILTLPDWHLGRVGVLNKFTLFNGLDLAVIVTVPHLLSSRVHYPLGVTYLLGHLPTDWHQVFLDEVLETILDTLLGGEAERVNTVVIEGSGEDIRRALGVTNDLAILVGDGHTSSSNLFVAHSTGSVCADGSNADVVLDLTVPGDVDTLIIMTISMVVTTMLARVSGHHEGKEDEKTKHVEFVRLS